MIQTRFPGLPARAAAFTQNAHKAVPSGFSDMDSRAMSPNLPYYSILAASSALSGSTRVWLAPPSNT